MSVDANRSISDVWAKLEGHVVDDVFPLRRFIGSSDHSGVFLTESGKRAPTELALKLVRAVPTLAESQLSLWRAAAGLAHPQLVRLFETGECRIGGLPYLYAVMEYADQDLAQLLQRRALTEDETREMLVPVLSALAFLHERKFVHGKLKPSNIQAVGDQLKLASETIRPVGEVTDDLIASSVDDPAAARHGSGSTAGDIWNLGITICEALTRRRPAGLHGAGDVVLPPELSPAFREIVARCLSRVPGERPEVAELEAWAQGRLMAPAAPAPAAVAPPQRAAVPEPEIPQPTISTRPVAPVTTVRELPRLEAAVEPVQRPASRVEVSHHTSDQQPSKRNALPLILAAIVVFALSWFGIRALRTNSAPTPPAATQPAAEGTPGAGAQSEAAPMVRDQPAPRPAPPASQAKSVPSATNVAALQEVLPDVSANARRTIRGTIRVSVRVIIQQDGTVLAALAENPGPSRYFERKAIEAAKKWTFAAADTEAQRIRLLRFTFTRDGATARVVTPR